MKLHIHIKKLFDSQNRYLRWEKKLAKENANKVRGVDPEACHRPLGSRWHNPFGSIWWRGWRGRGIKTAHGKLLPQTRTDVAEKP